MSYIAIIIMPSKKTSKVTENETTKVVDDQESPIVKKTPKTTKSKKSDAEPTINVETEKSTPDPEPVKTPKTKKKVKETTPDEEPKPIIEQTETKPKKKAKETTPNEEQKPVIEQIQTDSEPKSKKKVKETKKVTEPNVEIKETPSKLNNKTIDPEQEIQNELDDVKLHWLCIINKINDNEAEGKKLEIEKEKIVKKLKDLLDKLQTDDTDIKGFLIDNKIQLSNTKNDIIPIKSDSVSESDSCDESTDSDSEDTKPLLINKSSKTKTIIKTTKGSSKVPKLAINDSDSDSD